MKNYINVEKISKKYDGKYIIKDLSLSISKGEIVAICGPSGCGKTSLINMIGLLSEADAGTITIDGKKVTKKQRLDLYRNKISFLFQNFALVDDWTVRANLEVALPFSKSKKEDISKVLSFVKLEDKIESKIHSLSGGEQQRVALARLILQDNDIILADEPTGSLDNKNRDLVFSILKKLRADGKTIVIVTHDLELARACDRIITLKNI